MRQPLAAREQRIGELFGLHACIARHVLEPLHRVACGALQFQYLDQARLLVARQGGKYVDFFPELVGQPDRIFQRQPGAGADREVGRVGGVAHQHQRHPPPVELERMHPLAAGQAREADPHAGSAQVGGVRHQRLAVQVAREQALAEGQRIGLAHVGQAARAPGRVQRLDDEGRGLAIVLVGMRLEPAVFGFLEGEGEGIEALARAQPHEAAQALLDLGLERLAILLAQRAVHAVGGHHQVGVVVARQLGHVQGQGLEHQVHAQRAAARGEDVEQALAPDAAKAVAVRGDGGALEVDVDRVPMIERFQDGARARFVGPGQLAQRLVREHHTPAKGIPWPVALDDGHRMRRVAQFHEQAEIETGRAAAHANDVHFPSRCWCRR